MTERVDDFATTLRRAREHSGLSLRHISDATKMSVRNLSALESNHITRLPGGIYRRAIVRAYAAHVGLDPETTLRSFLEPYPDDVPSWADLVAQRGPTVRGAMHAIISAMSALTR